MREVELKFRVSPPFRIPELTGERTGVSSVSKAQVKELVAVYWDTSDLRLAREGITLRHRTGELRLLEEVGTVLRPAGAVGGEFVPKVVRALGPRATADPDPPPPSDVSAKDPARLAVQSVLRRYVRAFMANDQAVRRGAHDGVHQMRVAARRIRSALKTFRPLVDADWSAALREE